MEADFPKIFADAALHVGCPYATLCSCLLRVAVYQMAGDCLLHPFLLVTTYVWLL